MDGLRVLLLGGNTPSLSAIRRQLAAWQVACDEAADVASAAARLANAAASSKPFQIAIVESSLDGGEARQLAERRTRDGLHDTAVVAVVAMDEEPCDVPVPNASGIAGYLTKPITSSRLFDTLMASLPATMRPAAAAQRVTGHAARGRSRSTNPPSAIHDARILLVEDNEVNQQVAVELLRAAGYRCDVCGNGKEAVAAMQVRAYNLVLMDCQMPEMDGYEATRVIRERERAQGIEPLPIVALTANALSADRQRCLDAGMTDYLKKPLNRHELVAVLDEYLPRGENTQTRPADANARLAAASRKASPPDLVSPLRPPQSDADVSSDAEAPLDCASLSERFLGDWEFVQRLLDKFEKQIDVDLDQLERSVRERNCQQAAMLAHRLKGAAASISASEISRVAAELEALGRATSLDGAEQYVAALRTQRDRLGQFIRDRLPGSGAPPK